MKKKIAMILAILMLIPCVLVPANATSQSKPLPQVDLDMSLLSTETQETFFEQMELIAVQLRAQDAMEHYDFYANTVYHELLAMETDIMPLADYTFYAPYGAYVSYTYPDSAGNPYITTAISYMDPPKTNAVISDKASGYVTKATLEGAFLTILGFVPELTLVAGIAAGILAAEATVDIRTLNQIKDCGNYSLLQTSAFDGKSSFASVLRPWNSHDAITIPGHVIDISYEKYAKS